MKKRLGRRLAEAAIDCYEKWIERRYPLAPLLAFAVPFRFLRESPRWAKLAKMMNLPAGTA
jgi:hypothetical protein